MEKADFFWHDHVLINFGSYWQSTKLCFFFLWI